MTKHILNLCLYLIFHNLSWLNPNRSKCVNQAPTKSMLLCYMLDAGAIWDAKLSEINSWFSNLYGTFMSIRPKKKRSPLGRCSPVSLGSVLVSRAQVGLQLQIMGLVGCFCERVNMQPHTW